MTIPLIYIKGVRMSDVTVPNIFVPNWQSQQPSVDHLVPPVVLNIGNPIVDMPGHMTVAQNKKTSRNFVKYEGLSVHYRRVNHVTKNY